VQHAPQQVVGTCTEHGEQLRVYRRALYAFADTAPRESTPPRIVFAQDVIIVFSKLKQHMIYRRACAYLWLREIL
jgi:hypothetical protein